uniref:Uncharacterized protein n=1 Tax=Thermus islandicus TaxID=540988 RepID=A0A7C2C0S2_9DEIN
MLTALSIRDIVLVDVLDLGVRAFLLFGWEGGWLLGLGAGYALPLGFAGGGGYFRVLLGGARP